MRESLDFLDRPPFVFTVSGASSKIALGNKGFRPKVAGSQDRFEYWLQDKESATKFREAIADLEIYCVPIFPAALD